MQHQRHPHRFFLGLFAFSLVAIHLHAQNAIADDPVATGTATSTETSAETGTGTGTGTGTSTSTDTVVTPPSRPVVTEQQSVKALCDVPLDRDNVQLAGEGAPVFGWHAKNTADWQREATSFINDKRAKTIDNPELNRIHRAYVSPVAAA